ncbi:hypothetical protein KC878_04425 [Candidatus Saccharibacteria bacterium]|nr:hypothetical protein [Candidatus Saccharibacteria bacterium]MCB9821446.1 hypothetical protein [Candidatus Nomurabacteria bacterium]
MNPDQGPDNQSSGLGQQPAPTAMPSPNVAQTTQPSQSATAPSPQPMSPANMPQPPTVNTGVSMGSKLNRKAKIYLIFAGVIGFIAAVGGLSILIQGMGNLGKLENQTFASGKDYEYSMDVFSKADHQEESSFQESSTVHADLLATTNTNDEITSAVMVVVEDVESVINTVKAQGVDITVDDIFDLYLKGDTNTTIELEKVLTQALSLSNVNIKSDFKEVKNTDFSRAISSEVTGKSSTDVGLTGRIYVFYSDNGYAYTVTMLAVDKTWTKNLDSWDQIAASFAVN